MDVILDSNVYVSDYRMENIAFKNLFDHLRRTGESLVLLRIVREEVIAQFARDLKKRGKDVAEVWRGYRALHFPEKLTEFTKPDIAKQTKLLRDKLMDPSEAVRVSYHSDTTRISVDEIFLRGIHRTPPANGEGEELRDVIVWLSTLDYARTNNRAVAFITSDGGFWTNEEVRPEIQNDIKRTELAIRLYRNIERFVEENSPEAKAIEAKWADEIFPEFADEVIAASDRAIRSRRFFGTIKSASLKSVHFKEGKLYEVAPDVQGAELVFAVTVEFETRTVSNVGTYGSLAAFAGPLSPFVGTAIANPDWGTWVNAPGLGGMRPQNWVGPPASQVQPIITEDRYLAGATVRASARLLKGKISDKEVTEFQIEKIDRLGSRAAGSNVPAKKSSA